MVRLLLIAAVLVYSLPFFQPEPLKLIPAGDAFYVVADGLPTDIEPDILYNLYRVLARHVIPAADDHFAETREHCPVVVRFVADDNTTLFPDGTEGFGGMVGLAAWACDESGEVLTCTMSATEDAPAEAQVLLVVVADSGQRDQNLGLVAHELSHTLGTVDGALCPGDDAYGLEASDQPALSDAYWWYGVTGIFTLTPSGLVWDALNDRCAESAAPDICDELADALQGQFP